MKTLKQLSSKVKFCLSVCLLLGAILGTVQPAFAQDTKVYACPPCPVDCHDKTYSNPGVCPHPDCQMKLIDRNSVRYVAIVVWQGAEIWTLQAQVKYSHLLVSIISLRFYVTRLESQASQSQVRDLSRSTPNSR